MYSKFMSSFELHRNVMTTFRADISWSSLYAAQESMFMSIADDKDASKSEGVYKMLKCMASPVAHQVTIFVHLRVPD